VSRPNVPGFYVVYQDHDLTLQVADNVSLALAQVMLEKLKEFVGATGLVTQNLLYRVEQQLIGFLLELIDRGELREWSTSKVPGHTTEWFYCPYQSGKGHNWGPESS